VGAEKFRLKIMLILDFLEKEGMQVRSPLNGGFKSHLRQHYHKPSRPQFNLVSDSFLLFDADKGHFYWLRADD
jgi:hypothetical protein